MTTTKNPKQPAQPAASHQNEPGSKLAPVENKAVAPYENPGEGAWGAEGASSTEVLIPRLWLMQSISDQVKQEKCRAGDIVNSNDGTVLAPRGQRVEIIPFLTFRQWEITRLVPGQKQAKFLRMDPVDPANDKLPSEDVDHDGAPIQRSKVLNFFTMLPSQIEELPYLIKFRKSGLRTGKVLSTHFSLCAKHGFPPARRVFSLGSELQTSQDGNDYYVYTITQAREATKQELEAAYMWYTSLQSNNVKVVEQEETPF